jgi:hypothetical protein
MASSLDWNNHEWLMKRQASYDRLMVECAADLLPPASGEMFEEHKRVMRLLDALPISEGGRS